jgi:hypothetical protein
MQAAMRTSEVPEHLRQNSILPAVGTPEEFPACLQAGSGKWDDLIRVRGITME